MSTQCPAGTFAYVIRSGDNFYSLAQTYNTTVNAILAANPGVNPNTLQIGQRVCIPGTQPPPPTTCPTGTTAYVIKAGDTLFALARQFNTTVNAILAANPGIDPNALRVGQRICIPGVQPPPTTCPTGTTAYIVRPGDTVFALARQFNTTVNAILAANPGIDPNALRVGQRICIPGVQPPPTTCPTGTTAYVIKAGDTLFALARQFNTTVNAILAANPGIDPNALRVGQRICVPGTPPPPSTCPTGYVNHTVRVGDTLYRIAQRYNVTINAIIAANPGIDPNRLQVGTIICIPPVGSCVDGTSYTIQAGDTFFEIAQRFDVSLNALRAANPGVDPNRLFAGQRICIPAAMTSVGERGYLILPGETLASVAEKYLVTVEDLLTANPGLRPSDFIAGKQISIPLEQAPMGL